MFGNKKKLQKGSSFNELKLRTILENIPEGLITINRNGLIETVNLEVLTIFGYSLEEVIGKSFNMLMPKSYTEEHGDSLHDYLFMSDKKALEVEKSVIGRRKDGSTFHMELILSELDMLGEQLFSGIVRDITQRKRLESQFHESEERIHALIETLTDAIIIINENGFIETFNSAAEVLFGYDSSEVVQKSLKILMPEPYSSEHEGYIYNYLTTGKSTIIGVEREVFGKRKDGSIITIGLTVSEMKFNGKRFFNGIVRDISARKEAELILIEKKQTLEILAEFERTQSEVMAFFSTGFEVSSILDKVLNLLSKKHDFIVSAVYMFDEWQGILECVASYALPLSVSRQQTLDNGLIGQVAKFAKTIALTASDEMPFQIDTGLFSINPTALMMSPIIYKKNVLGVLAVAKSQPIDQNEFSFIERLSAQIGVSLNNLQQYHNMKILSDQLKQHSQEISQKNILLEQANRLKTEFLANMSHELRTPLNAIIGFSDVLKDQDRGQLNEEQADYIEEIFNSANHLLSLINDILDLSKIEAGKMELYLEPVNLTEIFRNSISIVKEEAHTRKINLKLTIANDVKDGMFADARKLKQIIFNLLSNAVKFTGDGGSVSIEVSQHDKYLEVKVTDTGIGISAKDIGLLFRPFEQLDGSLSRQYGGTGLGLALVRRLVDLHGGTVNVNSVEGEGSCFYFTIPYRESNDFTLPDIADKQKIEDIASVRQVSNISQDLNQKPTEIKKPLVLIVEAKLQTTSLIAIQLEKAGYATASANDADKSLELARTLLPDLIVVNVLSNIFNGWEIIQSIKNDSQLQVIPMMVVSFCQDFKKGVELGVVNVLEKPLNKKFLLESISQVLPKQSFTNTKVLVVDDDKKLVGLIINNLQEAGFDAIGAFGGSEAISLARSEHPQLIILDLIMPDVSGFDVLINFRSDPKMRDIPIIILSAKVLTDIEKAELYGGVKQIIHKHEFDNELFLQEVKKVLHSPKDLITSPEDFKILVVIDNQQQFDCLKSYLENESYQVYFARNGYEGLDILKNNLIDLVILDILMPELGGFIFLENKSHIPLYSRIPVMALSVITVEDQNTFISADAVLEKPVDRSEILPLIENILSTPLYTNKEIIKPKLLVIDDDPKAIKIISSYLLPEDYEVVFAFNGLDGIELAKTESPNLIVLDLIMPEMSGFEVLAILKNDEKTRHIPVFILTAKIFSNEERNQLQQQVELIAHKGKIQKELFVNEISRILKRYNKT